jgi:hypothetical protein
MSNAGVSVSLIMWGGIVSGALWLMSDGTDRVYLCIR